MPENRYWEQKVLHPSNISTPFEFYPDNGNGVKKKVCHYHQQWNNGEDIQGQSTIISVGNIEYGKPFME